MDVEKSAGLFGRAQRVAPGGLHTSLRALPWPLVFTRAEGAYMWDADGNRYLDYQAAFGPILLGHRHPEVDAAVYAAMERLDLFGAGATDLEVELAAKVVEHVPSAEKTLLCNSGSEATYHAVRLARAVTGRSKLVKFQGCYHGWHDYVAMNVISPAERMGKKDRLSAGMLDAAVEQTVVAPFNDLAAVERLFEQRGEEIAGVILEPIPHNIGCVLPSEEFLQGLRALCTKAGAVLIFDEVVTGFRHALGGYQAIAGVTPDLTTLGKAMANGYPMAALAGRADLMDRFGTAGGDVFFAGTFNGHASACAASLKTIELLESGEVYEQIFRLGERAREGLRKILDELGITATVAGYGSVFLVYFLDGPVERYEDLLANDTETDLAFRCGMVEGGIFVLPTPLKRNHISAAHTDADIDRTLEAAEKALREATQARR